MLGKSKSRRRWVWECRRQIPTAKRQKFFGSFFQKRTSCFFLAFCLPTYAGAQTIDPSPATLTLDENFKRLDISAQGPWVAHTPWHGDFGDAAFGDPGPGGPFSITPEGLAITARRDAAGHWQGGLICSRDRDGPAGRGFAQAQGYFEISAKLPDGPGVWPAFWLIGTDKSRGVPEIDVFEYYGHKRDKIHLTAHFWVNGKDTLHQWHVETVPAGSLSGGFNLYGVAIGPQVMDFYLNRRKIWSMATPPEYRQKFYVLADLALGGGWPISRLTSPQVMVIKYIHVYRTP